MNSGEAFHKCKGHEKKGWNSKILGFIFWSLYYLIRLHLDLSFDFTLSLLIQIIANYFLCNGKKINSKYLNLFLYYFSIVILYRKFVNTKSNLKLLLVLKNTLIFHVPTLKKGKEHVFTFLYFGKISFLDFSFAFLLKYVPEFFFSKMFKH